MAKDIRWIQRFSNYQKALRKLNIAIERLKAEKDEDEESELDEDLEEILKEGLIKRFEYTQELSWNVMKDYAEYQGKIDIKGPRDAIREAFTMGLIVDGKEWLNMLTSRNLTSHTYNSETAEEIHDEITDTYIFLFNAFEEKMSPLIHGSQLDLFGTE
jgi:nucleotidyltransferase substrate binding protein (TIGR01987 family)